jgi:hypothetical protein
MRAISQKWTASGKIVFWKQQKGKALVHTEQPYMYKETHKITLLPPLPLAYRIKSHL